MNAYTRLLQLSPNKVAQLVRAARKVQSITHGIYHSDTVFETLVEIEATRRENRLHDMQQRTRAKWSA